MGESKTKIAKRQLRSIRESRADDEVDRGWQDFHNGLERDPNGSVWYQDGYDEAKENAVKRGHGDTPRAMREASRVKIIKRQLRRIIKEEKARLLNEIAPDDPYASVGGPDPSPKRGPKIATAMGQTAKSDALFDARDNLLGLIETLDPAEFDSYIDSLIAELEMMKQGV